MIENNNLTVKDLKEAFGDKYPVINDLVADKPDTYVFYQHSLVNQGDYFVSVLWSREDIEELIDNEYLNDLDCTKENIDKVYDYLLESEVDDYANEMGIEVIRDEMAKAIERVIEENNLQEDGQNDD